MRRDRPKLRMYKSSTAQSRQWPVGCWKISVGLIIDSLTLKYTGCLGTIKCQGKIEQVVKGRKGSVYPVQLEP